MAVPIKMDLWCVNVCILHYAQMAQLWLKVRGRVGLLQDIEIAFVGISIELLMNKGGLNRHGLTVCTTLPCLCFRLSDVGLSSRQLAKHFQVGRTQILRILKQRDTLLEMYDVTPDKTLWKRISRRTEYEDINNRVWYWVQQLQASHPNIRVSGPLLREKALEVAKETNNTDFKASNGWLSSFIKRNCIVLDQRVKCVQEPPTSSVMHHSGSKLDSEGDATSFSSPHVEPPPLQEFLPLSKSLVQDYIADPPPLSKASLQHHAIEIRPATKPLVQDYVTDPPPLTKPMEQSDVTMADCGPESVTVHHSAFDQRRTFLTTEERQPPLPFTPGSDVNSEGEYTPSMTTPCDSDIEPPPLQHYLTSSGWGSESNIGVHHSNYNQQDQLQQMGEPPTSSIVFHPGSKFELSAVAPDPRAAVTDPRVSAHDPNVNVPDT